MQPARDGDRSLITGIGGFAGPYLAALLVEQGTQVAGYAIDGELRHQAIPITAEIHGGDIRDVERLAEVVAIVRPDLVFHLAALSHVGDSWTRRRETYDVNVLGTDAVLEAVARAAPEATVLLVSTGQVYGRATPEAMPLQESHPPRPVTPYTASKLCAEVLGQRAAAAGDVRVVIVRPFNFAGPGQDPGFVCSDFARQIAWAEAGLAAPTIVVGNLEARRDFTDVRDTVRGFAAAARAGANGEAYNVCSGREVPIREILETLIDLSDQPIEIVVDRDRLRPIDVPLFVGDPQRARTELGWESEISLRKTLDDTLAYWRRQAETAVRERDLPNG